MGLSATLNIAQSALASASAQSSVLSRNIANVGTAGYSRKTANLVTTLSGSSTVTSIGRATNTALLKNVLQAQSDSASQSAISDGLTQIQNSLGLNTTTSTTTPASATDQSPSTMIANLTDALQTYASQPDTIASGTAAVTAATALVTSLNQGTAAVQTVRAQADDQIASAVTNINQLLSQFQAVNQQIISGAATGADITDVEDKRDSILNQLSSQIGITTATTSNGGMQISTDSGVTLFDQFARQVSFTPTSNYTASTTGNAVLVDGVAITGASAVMGIKSGALAGLTQLRDTTSMNYQNQLDQMAYQLISTFAESGASGTAQSYAGLFTNGGSSTVPGSTSVTGLAASIMVNASVDPNKGGDVTLLRDGDVSGGNALSSSTAYTYNTSGDAAFSDRLNQIVTALGTTKTFDSSSGGIAKGSLSAYATSSVSWLAGTYQTASNAATYQSSVVSTATSALSNATGVNLDDQMSQMLDIEHAYQASAQLLNTVKAMYSALISAMN